MNKNHLVIGVLGVLVLVMVGMLGAEAFSNMNKKAAPAQEQAQPAQAQPTQAKPDQAEPEKPRNNGVVLVG